MEYKNRKFSSSQNFSHLEVRKQQQIAEKWDYWVCQLWLLKLIKWFQMWDSIQKTDEQFFWLQDFLFLYAVSAFPFSSYLEVYMKIHDYLAC